MSETAGTVIWPGPFTASTRIVAIGAHFDDIELACGGTIAAAAAAGCQVTFVVLTASGYVQIDGKERSEQLAWDEGVAAAAALGVSDVRCLGLRNARLEWSLESVAAIERVLTEVEPSVIFTHWSFDTHQDHHHGSMATLSAARLFHTVLMYEPIYPSGRSYQPFRPQLYFDITQTLEAKVASLQAHRSQLEKYGDGWLEAIRARATYRGYETGVAAAEAFEVVRLRVLL
ncbi:MAG: PIG-L family deacetylase [Fimbriimonadaceae bacterium]|nr:PIG-L family deacetylase [Fimbriimonadaceae bacterium]